MADYIEFYKPTLRRKDMQSVLQTMVDEKIGPGAKKQEFISLLCEKIKKKGGIALRSYYDAIVSSLKIAGVSEGSTVIISILAPKLYKLAISSLKAKAILIDINPETGCLDSQTVLNYISDKSADALILSEPFCQIPYNEDFSILNIPIIEDISQSFGSTFDDYYAGGYGDLVICAFEQEHIVSCGGGAAILYNDEKKYKDLIKKEYQIKSKYEQMPDLNASLGIIQLKEVESHLQKRNEIFNMFKNALMKTDHQLFGQKDINFISNGWSFPVILDSNPEDVIKFAKKYNVTCMKMFTNSVGNDYKNQYTLYKNASASLLRAVAFPIYPFLKASEIDILVKVISHLP
ncbi:MAG: DegT/DnrJ/EryC1/StrS family aminotransferase [Sphaerochaetaceae bacterium]|nr:DegT/DnrJ/EryC1/StrS family aminotransferase [Sphaerochaetaceae bacterium]MDC7237056.1 DegT/DnrJ/EryC1/StrS family aminotransferase [Sphaerochaetaceae bacterium]MDC7250969.1 DegT/DnrJ/EryC1/StrS family aminotransferase [Sphaerochaetaceae bacterium]